MHNFLIFNNSHKVKRDTYFSDIRYKERLVEFNLS